MNTELTEYRLLAAAEAVVGQLKRLQESGQPAGLVLAESCTAGLIAATLARVPGVSSVLTGSAVVYQNETKALWLGIDGSLLSDPGPVSRIVAERMAVGVLQRTFHATIGLSITGHLGPGAPRHLDGIAWCAVATTLATHSTLFRLPDRLVTGRGTNRPINNLRHQRQRLATLWALQFLAAHLDLTCSKGRAAAVRVEQQQQQQQ